MLMLRQKRYLQGDGFNLGVSKLSPWARGEELAIPRPPPSPHNVCHGLTGMIGRRKINSILPALSVHPSRREKVYIPVCRLQDKYNTVQEVKVI